MCLNLSDVIDLLDFNLQYKCFIFTHSESYVLIRSRYYQGKPLFICPDLNPVYSVLSINSSRDEIKVADIKTAISIVRLSDLNSSLEQELDSKNMEISTIKSHLEIQLSDKTQYLKQISLLEETVQNLNSDYTSKINDLNTIIEDLTSVNSTCLEQQENKDKTIKRQFSYFIGGWITTLTLIGGSWLLSRYNRSDK
jgi:hypothetical protein